MNVSVGSKVRSLRESAGLSQEQVAQFLCIDQSTISKLENGERRFQIDQLEQLGSLFGCALGDLVNKDEDVKPLHIAFRARAIENEDLIAIADIHKIAVNLDQMRNLLEGKQVEE
jgi:transcriptional regulator with XRE-family HTH domain